MIWSKSRQKHFFPNFLCSTIKKDILSSIFVNYMFDVPSLHFEISTFICFLYFVLFTALKRGLKEKKCAKIILNFILSFLSNLSFKFF